MDDPKIPQVDQERIDAMVAQYRHALENLYRLAHIQGAMTQVEQDVAALRAGAKV